MPALQTGTDIICETLIGSFHVLLTIWHSGLVTSRGNRLMNGLLPVKGAVCRENETASWALRESRATRHHHHRRRAARRTKVREGETSQKQTYEWDQEETYVSLLLVDRCLTYPARHWVWPWQPQHFLWFSNKLRRDECLLSNQHEN